jgi:hypothetical protein
MCVLRTVLCFQEDFVKVLVKDAHQGAHIKVPTFTNFHFRD